MCGLYKSSKTIYTYLHKKSFKKKKIGILRSSYNLPSTYWIQGLRNADQSEWEGIGISG